MADKAFEPITSQEEFDERIKSRLAREREKWEKEGGVSELRELVEAKDNEIAEIKSGYYREATTRAVLEELGKMGVQDQGRSSRILKHVDIEGIEADDDGRPRRDQILNQLASVHRDLPELLHSRGANSGGSSKPVLKQEPPLTRDEVANMSEAEINSRWDQVKGFLAGERS